MQAAVPTQFSLDPCHNSPALRSHNTNLGQTQGFYTAERALSNGAASTSARGGGGTAFGTAAPVQLPTPAEIRADREGFVTTIRRLCSPVYYSTLADGRIVKGWAGVPRRAPGGRPILFIANHQLFAADMYTVGTPRRSVWKLFEARALSRPRVRASALPTALPHPARGRPAWPLRVAPLNGNA